MSCTHFCTYCKCDLTCDKVNKSNWKPPCEIPPEACCEKHDCQTHLQLDLYKLKFEDAQTEIEKLKQINTTFRTLMLSPAAMDTFANSGEIDTPATVRFFVAKQRQGWESTSIDTLLTFLALFQTAAETVASILNDKRGKINIKRELLERTHKATQKAIEKPKERAVKLTAYEKAVKGTMKSLNCSKEIAEQMVAQMGMKRGE